MFRKFIGSIIGTAILTLSSPIAAQSYIPDLLELDGTETLEFPADERMVLDDGATIEFWVQPDWTEDPGYDPVILSNAGPEGPSYLVALLRDRDGLGIMVGDRSEIAAFDFSDGKMHHVAVIDDGTSVAILVNSKPIANIDMPFRKLPSAGYWIGSADGERSPFRGAIAGLRIWDVALQPKDIGRFAMRDIANARQGAHPDLQWLVGISDFANKDFILREYE